MDEGTSWCRIGQGIENSQFPLFSQLVGFEKNIKDPCHHAMIIEHFFLSATATVALAKAGTS